MKHRFRFTAYIIQDISVSARTKKEAKEKALDKLSKRTLKKSWFNIMQYNHEN